MMDDFDFDLGFDDLDMDLIPGDLLAVLDVDGNGVFETVDLGSVSLDITGDGVPDLIPIVDLDGDSIPDSIDPFLELDHNGLGDGYHVYLGQLRLHSPFGDGPSLGLVEVEPYVRTVADGIIENNLSYDGPVGMAPPAPGLEAVAGHLRTAADGIESNNLSSH